MQIINKNNEVITGTMYLKSVLAGIIGFFSFLLIIPLIPLLSVFVLWLGLTGCLELTNPFKKPEEVMVENAHVQIGR